MVSGPLFAQKWLERFERDVFPGRADRLEDTVKGLSEILENGTPAQKEKLLDALQRRPDSVERWVTQLEQMQRVVDDRICEIDEVLRSGNKAKTNDLVGSLRPVLEKQAQLAEPLTKITKAILNHADPQLVKVKQAGPAQQKLLEVWGRYIRSSHASGAMIHMNETKGKPAKLNIYLKSAYEPGPNGRTSSAPTQWIDNKVVETLEKAGFLKPMAESFVNFETGEARPTMYEVKFIGGSAASRARGPGLLRGGNVYPTDGPMSFFGVGSSQ
jgi:hypothetical protein